jgi:hypothetical protein
LPTRHDIVAGQAVSDVATTQIAGITRDDRWRAGAVRERHKRDLVLRARSSARPSARRRTASGRRLRHHARSTSNLHGRPSQIRRPSWLPDRHRRSDHEISHQTRPSYAVDVNPFGEARWWPVAPVPARRSGGRARVGRKSDCAALLYLAQISPSKTACSALVNLHQFHLRTWHGSPGEPRWRVSPGCVREA